MKKIFIGVLVIVFICLTIFLIYKGIYGSKYSGVADNIESIQELSQTSIPGFLSPIGFDGNVEYTLHWDGRGWRGELRSYAKLCLFTKFFNPEVTTSEIIEAGVYIPHDLPDKPPNYLSFIATVGNFCYNPTHNSLLNAWRIGSDSPIPNFIDSDDFFGSKQGRFNSSDGTGAFFIKVNGLYDVETGQVILKFFSMRASQMEGTE
ncbi:hypothetical protein [Limihaloglobus sulfuriphilus]|nr:hypothetical protein [Limihaloglobus sulfuriphilus]